ncbi:hypothetical protein O1611_g5448 [Lasiodiplodia mahajangana]|uniref:Uncharacterized protein n=1 Tax=Lasiodiplodia mahajangana TaxID=1108764 RepID=A0ACC2JLR5_9PEZI|nr:hypothetical protein O1611_g5448 [Lasiodiplodia mahajangana]
MASTITFGVPGAGWVYYQDKNLYDLTRHEQAPCFSFDTTQGRPETSVMIDPKTSALVVVDMQNFFLHPNCNNHPTGLEAAERTIEVVAKCRELGIQIIWLNWGLTEEDLVTMPPAVHKNFSGEVITMTENDKVPGGKGQARRGFGSDMGNNRGRLLMAKSWNAELYEPLLEVSDQERDIFCPKNRMSGMWTEGTPLYSAAKDRFRTLLFTGVNTDQCVLGTLVDAYNRSFDCIMLSDCCGTPTPGGQDVTVWNVSKGYGFVTDSKSFCNGVQLKTESEKLSHLIRCCIRNRRNHHVDPSATAPSISRRINFTPRMWILTNSHVFYVSSAAKQILAVSSSATHIGSLYNASVVIYDPYKASVVTTIEFANITRTVPFHIGGVAWDPYATSRKHSTSKPADEITILVDAAQAQYES